MRWLREVIRAHYWADTLGSVLFDLLVVALVVFFVAAIIKLA